MARRTKKERLLKLEEEAKTSGQPLNIDTDLLDTIFHLIDFPLNKEEALSFSKVQNSTLHLVFDVNQALRQPTDADDDETVDALQE